MAVLWSRESKLYRHLGIKCEMLMHFVCVAGCLDMLPEFWGFTVSPPNPHVRVRRPLKIGDVLTR